MEFVSGLRKSDGANEGKNASSTYSNTNYISLNMKTIQSYKDEKGHLHSAKDSPFTKESGSGYKDAPPNSFQTYRDPSTKSLVKNELNMSQGLLGMHHP